MATNDRAEVGGAQVSCNVAGCDCGTRRIVHDKYVKTLRDIGASEIVIATAEGRTDDVKRLMRIERNRWRLNAPRGFRWTDEDVLHQQNMAFLNGVMLGFVLGGVLLLILTAIVR